MWSNLHHTRTYWEFRDLPNFLFLHYNDMLADLDGAVRRIAAFVGLDVSEAEIERAVERTTFANVRRDVEARSEDEDMSRSFFDGGMKRFFFKGTNGRWRDVLDAEALALYEAAMARVLDPAAARWLEDGGEVS
jgi:aryl sulfotransferase